MKTVTVHYIAVISLLTLSFIALPVSAFAAEQDTAFDSTMLDSEGKIDHESLAQYHENLANEMRAKIEAQIEAYNHKPRTSFFGRNGQHIRKHVEYKIHGFEQAADENLRKAAYHKKMAEEQAYRPTLVTTGKTEG